MTDTTNPRAEFDRALAAMRGLRDADTNVSTVTMRATVACAEALSLLVDVHLPTPQPEPEPEPEPIPREGLPDDTPVGHGWVVARNVAGLFKPYGNGRFTRWIGARWRALGDWLESELRDTRPATVGDLRRVGLPVSEWPVIPTPEPEAEQPEAEAASALRAIREELAKLAVGYVEEGADARSAFREAMHVVDTEARRRGLDLGVATA